MVAFHNTTATEEMATGRLNWVREQVITHQAGDGEEEVNRELVRNQPGAEVVFLAVGNVLHPLLFLDAGFPPRSEYWAMMTISYRSQNSPFTNGSVVKVIPLGPFYQTLGSGDRFPPLPSTPLE